MCAMRVVDLSASEFSYLLATLSAPTVIGFDAPELFPAKKSARDTQFRQGREELEAHGWMNLIPDNPDEYELNAELFHLISVITSPSLVIATQRSSGEQEQRVVLHYLADESIVELSASEEGTYRIGFVADWSALVERISAMLQLAPKVPSKKLELDGAVFDTIQSLPPKGRMEKARASLESVGVEGKLAESILQAIYAPARGQLVMIRTHSGEAETGRRVLIFGEGKQAWSATRTSPDAANVELNTSDAASLEKLLAGLQDELTK